jgi:hypothetical protein
VSRWTGRVRGARLRPSLNPPFRSVRTECHSIPLVDVHLDPRADLRHLPMRTGQRTRVEEVTLGMCFLRVDFSQSQPSRWDFGRSRAWFRNRPETARLVEPVFDFIPESHSRSPRNAVRNHPGIAFILSGFPSCGRSAVGHASIRLLPYLRVGDLRPYGFCDARLSGLIREADVLRPPTIRVLDRVAARSAVVDVSRQLDGMAAFKRVTSESRTAPRSSLRRK